MHFSDDLIDAVERSSGRRGTFDDDWLDEAVLVLLIFLILIVVFFVIVIVIILLADTESCTGDEKPLSTRGRKSAKSKRLKMDMNVSVNLLPSQKSKNHGNSLRTNNYHIA